MQTRCPTLIPLVAVVILGVTRDGVAATKIQDPTANTTVLTQAGTSGANSVTVKIKWDPPVGSGSYQVQVRDSNGGSVSTLGADQGTAIYSESVTPGGPRVYEYTEYTSVSLGNPPTSRTIVAVESTPPTTRGGLTTYQDADSVANVSAKAK